MVPSTTSCKFLAVVVSLSVWLSTDATAQTYNFTFQPENSSLDLMTGLNVPVSGTLIGAYHPTDNPSDTQTRPGSIPFLICCACSSGNHAIAYSSLVDSASEFATQPAGNFTFDVDVDAEELVIRNFFMDVLNGTTPPTDTILTITFSTFHTFNPCAGYPGGTYPSAIEDATLALFIMEQVEDSVSSTLTPLGGDQYAVFALVDVMVTIEGATGKLVIQPEPSIITFAIEGTLTLAGDDAQMVIDVAIFEDSTNEGPFEPFEDVPFELLNPLGGAPGNALLSGVIQSISTLLDTTGVISAAGEVRTPCPPVVGDLDCNGIVNGFDLLILLGSWGPCENCDDCPANLNEDCTVNGFDLLILLSNWGSGASR